VGILLPSSFHLLSLKDLTNWLVSLPLPPFSLSAGDEREQGKREQKGKELAGTQH
jgi:hypothetical protein